MPERFYRVTQASVDLDTAAAHWPVNSEGGHASGWTPAVANSAAHLERLRQSGRWTQEVQRINQHPTDLRARVISIVRDAVLSERKDLTCL